MNHAGKCYKADPEYILLLIYLDYTQLHDDFQAVFLCDTFMLRSGTCNRSILCIFPDFRLQNTLHRIK